MPFLHLPLLASTSFIPHLSTPIPVPLSHPDVDKGSEICALSSNIPFYQQQLGFFLVIFQNSPFINSLASEPANHCEIKFSPPSPLPPLKSPPNFNLALSAADHLIEFKI